MARTGVLVQVTFFFSDNSDVEDVELPAAPREGERITKIQNVNDESGLYQRHRKYYVDNVEWVLEDGEDLMFIVELVLISDQTH